MTVKNTVNTANEIHVLAYPYEGQRTQIDTLHIMQSKFITNSIGVWCYFAWGWGGVHRSSSLSYRASETLNQCRSDLRGMADGRSHFLAHLS